MSSATVVRELYAALAARDAAAVEACIDANFAEDVVLHEPASLPWGGTHEGLNRVKRMFVGMALAPAGAAPMDAAQMVVERIAGDGDEVAVSLRFPFTSLATGELVDSGAVEWFSLRDGKVTEVRAVYLDTAALVAAPTADTAG